MFLPPPDAEEARDLLALRNWIAFEWEETRDAVLDAVAAAPLQATTLVQKYALFGEIQDKIDLELGERFLEQPRAFRTQRKFDNKPSPKPSSALAEFAPEVRAMIDAAKQQPAPGEKKTRRRRK
jgi:hypothetical protein